ncbi:MAG: carboxymuconolactone decarboxylase family protein [Corynebacterium sp.]|nr:carboxymuconolactone decarboxylase family protein [Corynebacterium sp.]
MTIENLLSELPAFAADIRQNFDALITGSALSEQQRWGSFLASAAATRNQRVVSEIYAQAAQYLDVSAINATLGTASMMAMNNVAFRSRGWLGADYEQMRTGLRMNFHLNSGVAEVDYELWALAVSAVNGCEHCLIAHEQHVTSLGLSKEQIFEAIKIAAVVAGVAQALELAAAIQ